MLFFRIDSKTVHVYAVLLWMCTRECESVYARAVCIDFALMNICNKLYHTYKTIKWRERERAKKEMRFPEKVLWLLRVHLYAQFFIAFCFCFRYHFRVFMSFSLCIYPIFAFFFGSNRTNLRTAIHF